MKYIRSRNQGAVQRARKMYQVLLGLLPSSYKKAYGQQMMILFQDLYREYVTEHGKIGIRFWIMILSDTFMTVCDQYIERLRHVRIKQYISVSTLLLFVIIPILTPAFTLGLGMIGFTPTSYPETGLGSLFFLLTLGFLFFPTSLTSCISSFISFRKAKGFFSFLVLWLIPTLVTLVIQTFFYPLASGISFAEMFSYMALHSFMLSIVPTGFAGVSVGIMTKQLSRGSIKISLVPRFYIQYVQRVAVFSCIVGLFFTFITGIFVNVGRDVSTLIQRHEGGYHYYIHRGLPIAYSGVSIDRPVPSYPIVALPFFKTQWQDNLLYIKVLHIDRFLLALLFYVVISIVPSVFCVSLIRTKRQFLGAVVGGVLLVILAWYYWGSIII